MTVEQDAEQVAAQAESAQRIRAMGSLASEGAMLAARYWYEMAAVESMPDDMRRALTAQMMQEFWEFKFHCHSDSEGT